MAGKNFSSRLLFNEQKISRFSLFDIQMRCRVSDVYLRDGGEKKGFSTPHVQSEEKLFPPEVE